MDERRGDWMLTFTGRRFWPLDPRPVEIAIEDIAHALSMICRYNGHTRRFYSVAEHSVLLCQVMTEREPENVWHQLQALMHDAAEAYLCDIVRPVKGSIPGYEVAEQRVEIAIRDRFDLWCHGKTSGVNELDNLILFDEARALLRVDLEPWHEVYSPGLGVEIVGLPPALAESAFLDAFHLRKNWRSAGLPAESPR